MDSATPVMQVAYKTLISILTLFVLQGSKVYTLKPVVLAYQWSIHNLCQQTASVAHTMEIQYQLCSINVIEHVCCSRDVLDMFGFQKQCCAIVI